MPTEVEAGTRSHLKNDELRAGLLNWPAERIADYLISFVGWDLDRRNLELCVIAQVAAAHELAVKAGVAADERAKQLIDAYVIGSGYAMGEPAIDLVKGLDLNSAQRIDVAAHARNHMNMKGTSGSCCKELAELARQLAETTGGERGT